LKRVTPLRVAKERQRHCETYDSVTERKSATPPRSRIGPVTESSGGRGGVVAYGVGVGRARATAREREKTEDTPRATRMRLTHRPCLARRSPSLYLFVPFPFPSRPIILSLSLSSSLSLFLLICHPSHSRTVPSARLPAPLSLSSSRVLSSSHPRPRVPITSRARPFVFSLSRASLPRQVSSFLACLFVLPLFSPFFLFVARSPSSYFFLFVFFLAQFHLFALFLSYVSFSAFTLFHFLLLWFPRSRCRLFLARHSSPIFLLYPVSIMSSSD